AATPQASFPPHRSISVDGIHAYADKLSVKPGETLNFYVSSKPSYTMRIFRLGPDPDKPISDQTDPNCDKAMSEKLTVDPPSQQSIHPGSYVYVKNGLAATANLKALTLECWVRPFVGTTPSDPNAFKYTGLITQFDLQQGAGYGLFVRFNQDDYSK